MRLRSAVTNLHFLRANFLDTFFIQLSCIAHSTKDRVFLTEQVERRIEFSDFSVLKYYDTVVECNRGESMGDTDPRKLLFSAVSAVSKEVLTRSRG
jgi:hypothetical protein